MKIIFIISALLIFVSCPAHSQDKNQKNGGRLESYKIAFITTKLNLSAEEAQKFWPVYNRYVNEIRETKTQNKNLDEIDLEEKIINIRKKYKNEFSQILTGDRVNQFFKVDKEFNNFLRKELQERYQINQLRQQNKRLYKQQ